MRYITVLKTKRRRGTRKVGSEVRGKPRVLEQADEVVCQASRVILFIKCSSAETLPQGFLCELEDVVFLLV